MQSFEYRVIAAPRRAKRARGARNGPDRFAKTLTDLINEEAAQGWEYLRADTMPMEEKSSMLGKAVESYQTVLVFRRATAAAQAAQGAGVHRLRPEAKLGPAGARD